MLVAGVACYRAWLAETKAAPDVVAGHSLGEYTALVAAGALSFAEALPLVRFRAQAMQEAVPVGTGAMAAILGLDAAAVIEGCTQAARETGAIVQAANFNDPKQTVIAGTKAGVDKACELLKAAGAKRALPLAVSAPFHSALMKPAAERLRERLATTPIDAPVHPGDRQHRRQERERAGGDPRCALSPGVRRGALGRDDPGHPRPRHHPHLRVRARAASSPAWSSASSPMRSRRPSPNPSRSPRRRRCCDERSRRRLPARSRSSPARRAASAGRSRSPSRPRAFASSARRRPRPARRRSAKRWRRTTAAAASSSTSPPATPPARRSTPSSATAARCTCWSTTPASRATRCRCG